MLFKFIAIVAFVGVASASLIRSDLGWNVEPELIRAIEEHGSHPQYSYTYGVEDSLTGDSKNLFETRDGDVVHGEYSLNDADGYRRTVKYTADDLNGFNAVVDRKPIIEAAPIAIKSVEHIAAPFDVKTIEPVAAPVFVKNIKHTSAPVAVKTFEHTAAPVLVKTVIPEAAPTFVKTVAPITYSAPPLIKSAPLTYSVPSFIKSAPLAYTAPIHIKSVPETYVTRSSFEPTLAYSAGPAIHKSVNLAYSAPTLLRSAPIPFSGSTGYIKSFPSVSQW